MKIDRTAIINAIKSAAGPDFTDKIPLHSWLAIPEVKEKTIDVLSASSKLSNDVQLIKEHLKDFQREESKRSSGTPINYDKLPTSLKGIADDMGLNPEIAKFEFDCFISYDPIKTIFASDRATILSSQNEDDLCLIKNNYTSLDSDLTRWKKVGLDVKVFEKMCSENLNLIEQKITLLQERDSSNFEEELKKEWEKDQRDSRLENLADKIAKSIDEASWQQRLMMERQEKVLKDSAGTLKDSISTLGKDVKQINQRHESDFWLNGGYKRKRSL